MDQAQKLVKFFPPDTSSNLFQNTPEGREDFQVPTFPSIVIISPSNIN